MSLKRRVVVEVTEEANLRAAFNFNKFPYERPRAGELPGFLLSNRPSRAKTFEKRIRPFIGISGF